MKLRNLLSLSLLLPASLGFAVNEGLDIGDNNFSSGAVFFTVPDSLTGSLSNDGGSFAVDYFRFTATAGVTYTFVSSGAGIDPDIDIENSSTVIINGRATNGHENFTHTATYSGTHYVVVYGAIQPFNYSVNVTSNSSVGDWELY